MPHFQLLIFLTIIISTLLLPFLSVLYQLGYNFISTKLFFEKKVIYVLQSRG